MELYVVIFYPKTHYIGYTDWKAKFFESQLEKNNLDYIDLSKCLVDYSESENTPIVDLFSLGHPTPDANDALTTCIIDEIPRFKA